MPDKISKVELEMIQKIQSNPVLWAKAYLVTYDGSKKEYTPWTARWYQAEMLMDKSRRKVYRCGRRTGGYACQSGVNCGNKIYNTDLLYI